MELFIEHGATRITLGTVAGFTEATIRVRELDRMFDAWEAAAFPALPANSVLHHYEGCCIVAVVGGREYLFGDGWTRIN